MPTKSIVAMTSGPVRRKRKKPPLNLPVVEGQKITRRKRRWLCSCGTENKVKATACANCGMAKSPTP